MSSEVRRNRLVSTGQAISEVGFGCWQLGGRGWGRTRERSGLDAVVRALELGINLFDTAPVYGFGLSEELLGKALAGARDSVVVTKAGLVWDRQRRVRHDASPESLELQLEASLRRLRRDIVDVYLLHWPDPGVPLGESVAALESLRSRGLVRAWGLSNVAATAVEEALPHGIVDPVPGVVLELPMNLLDEHCLEGSRPLAPSDPAELLAVARRRRWDVLAYDVLARGILAGGYDRTTRFGRRDVRSRDARFRGERFEYALDRVERLRTLARELGTSCAALAIRAVLDRSRAVSCLVGMRETAQVVENARASRLALSPESLERALTLLAAR